MLQASVTLQGFDHLKHAINAWTQIDCQALLQNLGAAVENQSRQRISEERTSATGQAWPNWSPAYARTRHANQHLLQNTGLLIDALATHADTRAAVIGTNLQYAAVQQYGNAKQHIPARPFLGVNETNLAALQQLLQIWVTQQWSKAHAS